MHTNPLSRGEWAFILVSFLLLLAFVGLMNQIIRDLLWVLFSYTDQGVVFAAMVLPDYRTLG